MCGAVRGGAALRASDTALTVMVVVVRRRRKEVESGVREERGMGGGGGKRALTRQLYPSYLPSPDPELSSE